MEHLAYHNVYGTESVKCSLEEVNLVLPQSHVATQSNRIANAPVRAQKTHSKYNQPTLRHV